jgi:hypothetical protein
MARCSVSAVACSRLYLVAWSKKTACRVAKSIAISMSYRSNRRVPASRKQQNRPTTVPLEIAGSSSIDVSESSPLTGLRRQARASFLADSAETASSSTGAPVSMQRE